MEQLNFISRLEEIAELNSSFATGRLRVCYHGKNRNGSYISKEVLEAAIPTMFNCPIVAHYYRDEDSIGSHDLELIAKDGGLKLVAATQPVGVVPENDVYFWETVEEDDGSEHEYLVMPIILWKRQEDFEHIAKEGSIAESMECTFDEEHKDKDGTVVVDKMTMQAFCLLESAEPCYESAAIDVFDKNNFKEQFSLMAEAWKEACGSENFSIKPFEKGGQGMENELKLAENVFEEETSTESVAETAPAEEAALTEEPAPEAVVEQEPAKAEQEAPEENGEAGAEPETEAFSKIKIGKNTMYEKLDKLRAILPNKYENDENTGMVNIAEYWLQDADADYIYVDAYYYRRENADAEAFEDNQVGRFKYAEVNGEYAIVGDFEPMEVCWLTIEESQKLDADRAEAERLKAWYGEYQKEQIEKVCESFGNLASVEGYNEITAEAKEGKFSLDELKEKLFALKGKHAFALEQSEKPAVVHLETYSNRKDEDKYGGIIFRHYD